MLEPLEHVETRSPSPKSEKSDQRQSSIGSGSVPSTGDTRDSSGTRGRRSRPSVIASQLHLPSVHEMQEQKEEHRESRALSAESTVAFDSTTERPSLAVPSSTPEKVISSRDVCNTHDPMFVLYLR